MSPAPGTLVLETYTRTFREHTIHNLRQQKSLFQNIQHFIV